MVYNLCTVRKKKISTILPLKKHVILISISIILVLTLGVVLRSKSEKSIISCAQLMLVEDNNQPGVIPPPYWVSDSIKSGDKELVGGKKVLEVARVQRYQEGNNKVTVIDAEISLKNNPSNNKYRYRQQDLNIGSIISIAPGQIKTSAKLINLSSVCPQLTKIIVEGYLYNQRIWLSNQIKVGDSLTDSSTGDRLIKVLTKNIVPSDIGLTISGGKISLKDTGRDLVTTSLKLEMLVTKSADTYYFASLQPVKLGNLIYLPLDKYNLYEFNVSNIQEVQD